LILLDVIDLWLSAETFHSEIAECSSVSFYPWAVINMFEAPVVTVEASV